MKAVLPLNGKSFKNTEVDANKRTFNLEGRIYDRNHLLFSA